ncbi:MAG: DUF1844 domain-containing protein [Deltaproteobacteria bacterium]|nr:DUF1844 domain-containing protein [Deltaproteobacteria bacterium]
MGDEQQQAIDFSTFVFSLAASAQIQLGMVPDPTTQKEAPNLPMARQTIDLIALLQEKTKGNLSEEENQLMEAVLHNLRLQYVERTKKGVSG